MRQNLIIALLSAIATLLLVVVLRSSPQAVGQSAGGGTAMGGELLCATGNLPGGAAGSAFWLFDPRAHKIAVYYLGNGGLEVKAVRDVGFDMEAVEFSAKGGQQTPTYAAMKKEVQRIQSTKASADAKAQKAAAGKKTDKKGGKPEETGGEEESGE
jgi:hypothetical protein